MRGSLLSSPAFPTSLSLGGEIMRRAIAYAVAAGILWGVTYPLAEVALSLDKSFEIVTAEVSSFLAIVGILHVLLKNGIDIDMRQLKKVVIPCLLLGLLNVLSMYLFYIGIRFGDSALIAFTAQLYPIITMTAEDMKVRGLVPQEHVPILLLYAAGLFLFAGAVHYSIIAVAAGLCIAVLNAAYVLLYNRLCNTCDYRIVNLLIFLFTAVIAEAVLALRHADPVMTPTSVYVCAALGAVVYACYMLEGESHRELSPSIVAFALSLEPVVATALTCIITNQLITPAQTIGAVLMLLAVYGACRETSRTSTIKSMSRIMCPASNDTVERVRTAYRKMLTMFYKLEDEVTGIFIALLSRENYVLIGPPGTGKTTLIYTLSKLLNAKWFYRQLTKFTDLEELLGPIDIAELLKGRVVRIYTNSIVEADLALLDEIFNASSAILNTLLSILNERVIYDGDKVVPVKTWTVYASSNRVPEDEELQALYDRFPLRSFLNYLPPEETENLIIKGWLLRKELDEATAVANMDDVKQCHEMLMRYVYDNLNALAKHVAPIIASFVEHVQISNRTRVKTTLYVISYIILTLGRIEADPHILRMATLRILKYLVSSREQLQEYYTFLKAHMPDELTQIFELINEAKALINNLMFDKARERIEQAQELLTELKNKLGNLLTYFFKSEIEEIESTLTKLRESIAE